MTTQQFTQSKEYKSLGAVGLVFIDGYHSEEQTQFDYGAFEGMLEPNGVILFHDSARCGISRMYGADRIYERRVKCFTDKLRRDPRLQVFDLPFGEGVTLVRRLQDTDGKPAADPGCEAVV